jgi:glycogen(starch) synthase
VVDPGRHPGAVRGPLVVAWGRIQYEKGFQVLARAIGLLRTSVPASAA